MEGQAEPPGVGGGLPEGGIGASWRFLLSGTWHQLLHFDLFYFKLTLVSLLGEGRSKGDPRRWECGRHSEVAGKLWLHRIPRNRNSRAKDTKE